jgi:hypothetical protein
VCEFDVLDELLITDGALTPSRYKALVIFQGEVVDQPVLDRLDRFRTDGGRIVVVGDGAVRNVEGRDWAGAGAVVRTAAAAGKTAWVDEVARQVEGLKGVDGRRNGVWTTRRGRQLLLFNSTDKAVHTSVDGQPVELPPYGIAEVQGH